MRENFPPKRKHENSERGEKKQDIFIFFVFVQRTEYGDRREWLILVYGRRGTEIGERME